MFVILLPIVTGVCKPTNTTWVGAPHNVGDFVKGQMLGSMYQQDRWQRPAWSDANQENFPANSHISSMSRWKSSFSLIFHIYVQFTLGYRQLLPGVEIKVFWYILRPRWERFDVDVDTMLRPGFVF